MFPSPLDIPASVDCVAVLAKTGIDAQLPLVLGLVAVVFGVVFFALARGRMRRGGVTLGLVLLLAAGGGGLALTAPAGSASADNCTPLDYSIEAELLTDENIDSGDDVAVAFAITNVVDRKGTPPIVVTIPKLQIASAPVLAEGVNWTLDATTSATDYLFTYNGPLPKDTVSSTAVFAFALATVEPELVEYEFPVSIVTGSGGDTNTANNTALITVENDGTVDYAIVGEITPTSAQNAPVPTGSSIQVDLYLTNELPRDGRSPIVVRIPNQPGFSTLSLGGTSTGWSIAFDGSDYVLTYTPVIVAGASSSTATLTFTANNGNVSTVDRTVVATIETNSGGDSDVSNNSVTLPLWVGGSIA